MRPNLTYYYSSIPSRNASRSRRCERRSPALWPVLIPALPFLFPIAERDAFRLVYNACLVVDYADLCQSESS